MRKSGGGAFKATFQYSEEKILEALRPRALPIYTEEEAEIREALILAGAGHILGRRKGGLTDRSQAIAAACRQATIVAIYKTLTRSLSKTPTGTRTIAELDRQLQQNACAVSTETIKRDLKALGTGALRSLAEPQNRRPWFVWLAPDETKARKRSVKYRPDTKHDDREKLSEKTRIEMEAGRRALAAVSASKIRQQPHKPK
jgi:hypothetical protein